MCNCFSSTNGYGNIFERCIANATQALSTTDSTSLVAGFALKRHKKAVVRIINCESANAIASSNGVTVPYGIVLTYDINDLLVTVTHGGSDDISRSAAAWSPDGRYLLTTAGDTPNT